MKISKQQWMLIAGVGILAVVYWFFFRKKKAESGYDENVMIFGNESGYDAYEVGPGFESGYGPNTAPSTQAVSCPIGYTGQLIREVEILTINGEEVKRTTWYIHCVKKEAASSNYANSSNRTKPSTNRLKVCFDKDNKEIPCPPKKPENIIKTETIG
jgi:LPXTG-motif cell wall-anchored protein